MHLYWLLTVPDTELADWRSCDFDKNGRLNAADLSLMKRELIGSMQERH